jgi:hypothetical protein
MERGIITMNECGAVTIPSGEIWMSEMELTDLFGVIAPTFRAAIRAVYKSGVLKEYEAEQCIHLPNGNSLDVFGLPMIVALVFRVHSFGAEKVRHAILERMYRRKENIAIFLSFSGNGLQTALS